MKIPKELIFEYLLSLENYTESHPSIKDITLREALDKQKKIIDLGFSDKDIINMKSDKLMLEYKLWRKETGQ
tara:strand:+ start:59 stop:274 length:216 start_codon:yes stop_codon:yes gene_type:complete